MPPGDSNESRAPQVPQTLLAGEPETSEPPSPSLFLPPYVYPSSHYQEGFLLPSCLIETVPTSFRGSFCPHPSLWQEFSKDHRNGAGGPQSGKHIPRYSRNNSLHLKRTFLLPESLGDTFPFSVPRGRSGWAWGHRGSLWALLAKGPQSDLVLRMAPRTCPPPQRNQMGSAGIL